MIDILTRSPPSTETTCHAKGSSFWAKARSDAEIEGLGQPGPILAVDRAQTFEHTRATRKRALRDTMKPRTKLALAAWIVAASLPAGPARAQQFTFKAYDGTTDENLTDVDLGRFFNMARCLCDAATKSPPWSFYLAISSPGDNGRYEDQEVYFLVGDNCDSDVSRPNCHEFDSINYTDFNREQKLYIPVNWIVDPQQGTCPSTRDTSTLFLFMTPEKNSSVATYAIDFDTKSPDPPTVTDAEGGEGSVTVRWERPDSNDEDIQYFDVLCEIDGAPPEVASADLADWTSTEAICGKRLTPSELPPPSGEPSLDAGSGGQDGGLDGGPGDGEGLDAAPPGAAPVDAHMADASTTTTCTGGLVAGDWPQACYVCATAAATASELRVSGLPNGVEVRVAVVAVDNNGNPSLLSNVETATPLPTTDFAEHYVASGGKGKGGFCFVATVAYGSYDHPHVRVLRQWRDQVLLHSRVGRAFVRWYYANGRALARPFVGRPWARALLRLLLLPLVLLAWLWVRLGGMVLLFLGTVVLGAGLRWRRSRRGRRSRRAHRGGRE